MSPRTKFRKCGGSAARMGRSAVCDHLELLQLAETRLRQDFLEVGSLEHLQSTLHRSGKLRLLLP